MTDKYRALKFVVKLLKVIAVLTGITGLVLTFCAATLWAVAAGSFLGLKLATPIIFLIGILVTGLVTVFEYAHAELLSCIVDIAENTGQISRKVRWGSADKLVMRQ